MKNNVQTCIFSITTTQTLLFTTETQTLLNPGRSVCSQTLVETVQLLATRQLLATLEFYRIAESAIISD
jgi:hypothetical protein